MITWQRKLISSRETIGKKIEECIRLLMNSRYVSLWHSAVPWMRNISVPEKYGFDTIICVYLVALSHIPPSRVLEGHINGNRGITIHITESKIDISYSKNHDSTLFFYCFYMLPLSALAHTIFRVVLFRPVLGLMLQNLKNKLSWCLID